MIWIFINKNINPLITTNKDILETIFWDLPRYDSKVWPWSIHHYEANITNIYSASQAFFTIHFPRGPTLSSPVPQPFRKPMLLLIKLLYKTIAVWWMIRGMVDESFWCPYRKFAPSKPQAENSGRGNLQKTLQRKLEGSRIKKKKYKKSLYHLYLRQSRIVAGKVYDIKAFQLFVYDFHWVCSFGWLHDH